MAAQTIPDVQLIDNSEQRTPLALVLDCSGSMDGAAIQQLNSGLALLAQELKGDSIASKRVRLLVLEFGGQDEARIAGDWIDAMEFAAPNLTANGTTPTGQAVDLALAKIEEEKQRFKQAGVAYTRPWLFLMSDGVPTDDWQGAADRCRQAEKASQVAVFPSPSVKRPTPRRSANSAARERRRSSGSTASSSASCSCGCPRA